MEKQNRRSFLKTAGLLTAAVTGISSKSAKAEPEITLSGDRMGMLVDTTVCIGCRNCEWACKTAHDLPTPEQQTYSNRSVFKEMRRPNEHALTVVNEYNNEKNSQIPVDVKVQCMHCDHPACVSACIVGAMQKHDNGAVTWDTSKCIGCRYCMVACPFQVPSFEYDKAINPKIMKCDFCFNRTKEGKLPACAEICPVGAITYGKRSDLIEIAREKIRTYPDKYIDHIYGEKEVGGTSWMYLASQKFDTLQFPTLGDKPAPGVSESIQHGIFAYFVPPASLYALLAGLMWVNNRREEKEESK